MTAPAGLELRPATAADLLELVRLHAAAFPDSESTALGPRYLRALLGELLAEPRGIALLAQDAGAAAGFVFGSPHGSERTRYRRLLPTAAAAWLARPALWLRPGPWRVALWRLRSLGHPTAARRAAELPAPLVLLDLIGVDPRARGRGAGALLMSGFAAAARDRGARTLLLWVRRDAEPARRLYARAGWREAFPVEPDRLAYTLEA